MKLSGGPLRCKSRGRPRPRPHPDDEERGTRKSGRSPPGIFPARASCSKNSTSCPRASPFARAYSTATGLISHPLTLTGNPARSARRLRDKATSPPPQATSRTVAGFSLAGRDSPDDRPEPPPGQGKPVDSGQGTKSPVVAILVQSRRVHDLRGPFPGQKVWKKKGLTSTHHTDSLLHDRTLIEQPRVRIQHHIRGRRGQGKVNVCVPSSTWTVSSKLMRSVSRHDPDVQRESGKPFRFPEPG